MHPSLQSLESEVIGKIPNLTSESELFEYKNSVLGKDGSLTEILKGIRTLPDEQKKSFGKESNELKGQLTHLFEERLATIRLNETNNKLRDEYVDVTIPVEEPSIKHTHPITGVLREIEDSFKRMGFDIYQSDEVTTEYWNFDSLNIPTSHPARDMQDTFWLEWEHNVLSTQTSSMQNRILRTQPLPIRAIISGRVFRNEATDATHDNTFYQVEGIVVDKNITLANLKYTLKTALSDIFWKEVNIRMRPGYFPFVEPGVEVDFSCTFCNGTGCRVCKKSGWIEFMGAGLIHPNVLKQGGINAEETTGFAFGFGLNRLVMMRYGIPDIRYFQNPNLAFLKQF